MSNIQIKAAQIRLLLTDCDGVLTDAGVYYSDQGEEMKRFSMRDGMGVERLRKLAKVEVGIVTGENSLPVARRASKLSINELHLGCKDKLRTLLSISERNGIPLSQIAFIGDDMNDLAVLQAAGLSACPADGMDEVKELVDYSCRNYGGHGAFREFAELIIKAKSLEINEIMVETNGHVQNSY
ncbi:MAG: HAD hydrolase family protein [Bacteroidetes bacterium]|nr:HAD hydrolase family protein [Bacteroidota bacterium]